jgi:hypothetical protein
MIKKLLAPMIQEIIREEKETINKETLHQLVCESLEKVLYNGSKITMDEHQINVFQQIMKDAKETELNRQTCLK